MRPCDVRQARWKVVVVVEAPTYQADERENNKKPPAGVITRLYPTEVCMERGSSGVVPLQTW